MMKINRVLLDTCFLIELADSTKPCHQNALDYFNYFNQHNIPYYLSPIVVSEYWQNDLIKSFPINKFRLLSFNFPEGHLAAKLNSALKKHKAKLNPSLTKHCIKDDIKIISHLLVNNSDIDCFITKDSDCIKDFIKPLSIDYPVLNSKLILDINYPISQTLEPQTKLIF